MFVIELNDHLEGLIDGVGMALCFAEKNRKNPKCIESLLTTLIRDLAIVSGNDQLSHVNFELEMARKHGIPYPNQSTMKVKKKKEEVHRK